MRRRRARLLALGLVTGAVLLQVAPAAVAATPATIKGKVGNGTEGGQVPRDLTVTAVQIGTNGDEVGRKQTTVGQDDTYSIQGFDLDIGTRFAVTAEYLGVSYSRVIDQPPKSGDITADLVIHETTDDESVVSISSDVLTIVENREGPLEVIQLQRVRNSSDRTFVGQNVSGTKQVLRLPVPAGAFELLPLEGISVDDLATVGGGIVTGIPLVPGERPASFVYKIKSPGGWSLNRRIFYPTNQADVLVSPNLRFDSQQFKFQEEVKVEKRKYLRFRGGPFDAGGAIEASITTPTGLPGPGLAWGLAGGLGLIALLGAGALLLRRRGRVAPALPTDPDPLESRQVLVERIAALDDQFEKGVLSEEEYADRRSRLKALLASETQTANPSA